ncbi:hypothetical protein FSP39_006842 [Pinctada imbricata]|uniref:Caveolin n=2 Tax=Pinctada TaxID=50425 RepID=A0AA88YBK9_PINIB|nr:hypothetical protein FSP39_006842 [Pinctada imbricata]
MTSLPLNLENRDINEINNHVQVAFEDVLAEPPGLHSLDCVWSASYAVFECSKNCCYKLMTLLCGICIALEWGCTFAEIAFQHVWCHTPCLRVFTINALCFQKFYGTCMNCCLAPVCETCGLCFSKITVSNK